MKQMNGPSVAQPSAKASRKTRRESAEEEYARESRELGWAALVMAAVGVFLIWLSSGREKPDPEISSLGGICFVPLILWVIIRITRV